jgi:hypothetical protein
MAILDGVFFGAASRLALFEIAIQLRVQSSLAAIRACYDSARIGEWLLFPVLFHTWQRPHTTAAGRCLCAIFATSRSLVA